MIGAEDDADLARAPDEPVFEAAGSRWIRAGRGGIFRRAIELGARVGPGAVVGTIADVFGDGRLRVRAREAGVVVGHTTNPLVYRGDALVHVAYA
jgi:predicted deacylase